ncbi:MAG TPA: hypothetical protein VLC79_01915 [Cellvibrio sp.]|nr:hypothetical protein [Cellvibrio sp.]
MFRFLSDTEVALNELLVACRASVDHYQDAIKLVEDKEIVSHFHTIASQRKKFCKQLEDIIRELGDLPTVPDPDKETGEMILHHLGAALSPDYTEEALNQRLAIEENIMGLIDTARGTQMKAAHEKFLDSLATHIQETIGFLAKSLD